MALVGMLNCRWSAKCSNEYMLLGEACLLGESGLERVQVMAGTRRSALVERTSFAS